MRTNAKVNNRAVVAIAHGNLPFPVNAGGIMATIRIMKIGKTDKVKDFLLSGSTDRQIVRGPSSVRRRCLVIYLDCIPNETAQRIKDGDLCINFLFIIYVVLRHACVICFSSCLIYNSHKSGNSGHAAAVANSV